MAYSLHTTKRYDIQYGATAICGWDEIENFLDFLRELNRVELEEDAIYITDGEDEVEIPFSIVEKYRDHEKWGNVFDIIWKESDKNNEYAHLSIW